MKGVLKNVVFIIWATPFNTVLFPEALRMAIGQTVSDNRVSLLLMGDGVWNALNLVPHMIGRPDIHESMELLSACGVRVFADERSLKEREIGEHGSHVEKIGRTEAYHLITDADVVMNFR